jgi:hypothetical protein
VEIALAPMQQKREHPGRAQGRGTPAGWSEAMSLLLVPLFVSAIFFLGVWLRDLRGDFRERTHYFESLDASP